MQSDVTEKAGAEAGTSGRGTSASNGKSENRRSLTRLDVLRLLERQDFKCAITGKPLTPQTASMDHIVPLSRGGSHEASNAMIVLREINSAKGSLTIQEFVEMCRAVANGPLAQTIAAPIDEGVCRSSSDQDSDASGVDKAFGMEVE